MHASDGHGFLLRYFMNCISTPIANRPNPSIFQNKKGIGSRQTFFEGGLQFPIDKRHHEEKGLVHETNRAPIDKHHHEEKGLVHETNHACRLALSSTKREYYYYY